MSQQPQPPNIDGNLWFQRFLAAMAAPLESLLRKDMGARYTRSYMHWGLASMLVLLMLAGQGWRNASPSDRHLYSAKPIFWFIAVYLAGCAWANLNSYRQMYRTGLKNHSYYSGTPRLWFLFRRWVSETTMKRMVEPALVMFAGMGVYHLSVPLGLYLFFASFALAAKAANEYRLMRERAVDIHDADLNMAFLEEHKEEVEGRGQAYRPPPVASVNPRLRRR